VLYWHIAHPCADACGKGKLPGPHNASSSSTRTSYGYEHINLDGDELPPAAAAAAVPALAVAVAPTPVPIAVTIVGISPSMAELWTIASGLPIASCHNVARYQLAVRLLSSLENAEGF